VENVEEYHAVNKEEGVGKRTQSVDGESGQRSTEEFELDEFEKINNLTKARKSEHEIPHEDIKALEEFMKISKQ
jgi:hypothetical protein